MECAHVAARVDALLALPLAGLDPAELRARAQAVHDGAPASSAG